jgi:hypothetical protein
LGRGGVLAGLEEEEMEMGVGEGSEGERMKRK